MKFKNRKYIGDKGEVLLAEINNPSDEFILIYELCNNQWTYYNRIPTSKGNFIPDNLSTLQQALYPEK